MYVSTLHWGTVGAVTENETNPRGGLADEWFGRNLKAARETKGLSQAAVAEMMRAEGFPAFTQQMLAKVEAGPRGTGRQVSVGEAFALGRIVGVAPAALIQPPELTRAQSMLWSVGKAVSEHRAQADFVDAAYRAASRELRRQIDEVKAGDLAAELAEDIAAAERILKGERP